MLYRQIIESNEPLDSTAPSFVSVFAGRKDGTLRKRLSGLMMYRSYCLSLGFHKCIFAEKLIFNFLQTLHSERAPPTRARHVREAIHLACALLGVPFEEIRLSKRISGIAVLNASRQRARRQRAPLTVPMVAALEAAAMGPPQARDTVLAGTLLFALFGRVRIGDLVRSNTEPFVDDVLGDGSGYAEGAFLDHKTAKAGSRESLPVVVHLRGITGAAWVSSWLSARRHQELSAAVDGTLFPAPGRDGRWTSAPATTRDAACILRTFLVQAGFSSDSVMMLGAHSLKVTTLSWMAKLGIDKEVRRFLGYHSRPGDRSVETYSRDAAAGPLRVLGDVLQRVRDGCFDPDASRSGRLLAASSTAPSPPAPSSTSSSSSALEDEDGSGGDGEADSDEVPDNLIINSSTKMIHRTAEGKLLCGKQYPLNFAELTSWPEKRVFCARCF